MRDELRKRNLKVSGKKSELIERLNENGISAPPKTTTNTNNTKRSGPAPEWKTSLAKAYLQKQLMDDKSPFHSMTPEQIHKSWDGFGDYPLSNFKSNMKNLMEAVSKRKKIVKEDERIFQLEQTRFPRKARTTTGKHFWDKHPANELLHEDVENGTADLVKPIKLRDTRNEYQDFDTRVFCDHVQQEKRAQRENPYWIPKRNRDALAKHFEEVEALKSEFDTRHLEEELEEVDDLFKNLEI